MTADEAFEQYKERSKQRTTEYHTKCLLEILERLDELNAKVAFVEQEILAPERSPF